MGKIIIITFAFMAFAFYELSDGSDFVPIADEKRAAKAVEQAEEDRIAAAAKAERLATEPTTTDVTPSVVLASAVVDTATAETPLTNTETATLALDEAKAEDIVAQAVEVALAEAEPDTATATDIREVTAARVNMRDGPGQNFGVIAKLTNGQQVEILQDPGDGWVKLRVTESGREGWMADFLLTASNI